MKEDYEAFKKFLQNEIDSGFHKMFLFNKDNEVIDEFKNVNVLSYIENMEQEIERLNNIINELEKWLEERLDKLDINGYDDDVFNGIELALYKLQELKHKKIYGSVDSEIVYFGELGSDKE